jgi:hypothetical protein
VLNLLELARMSVVEYYNWVELEVIEMSCMPDWIVRQLQAR